MTVRAAEFGAARVRKIGDDNLAVLQRHIVKTVCRVRVRVGERKTVVAAVAHARKFFRWMIIYIRLHHFAVIIAAVAIPIIMKRMSDIVSVVDD